MLSVACGQGEKSGSSRPRSGGGGSAAASSASVAGGVTQLRYSVTCEDDRQSRIQQGNLAAALDTCP
jgi:hypothetical protein